MARLLLACLLFVALAGCRATTSLPALPAPSAAPSGQPDTGPWAGIAFACCSLGESHALAFLTDGPVGLRAARSPLARGLRPLAWSADGRWLALEGAGPGGRARVHLLGGPNDEPLPLAPDDAGRVGQYRYLRLSPVGSHGALVDANSSVWLWGEGPPARAVGRMVPPKHPGMARYDLGQIAFSPDGRRLAWVTPRRRLAYLDIAGGTSAALTDVVSDRVVWSPDSRAILTYEEHDVPFREGACYGILCLPEGRWNKLMDAPEAMSPDLRDAARWSPDGSLLALNLARTSLMANILEPAGPTRRSGIVVFDVQGHPKATFVFALPEEAQPGRRARYAPAALVPGFIWHADGRSLLTWEQGRVMRRSLARPQEAALVAEEWTPTPDEGSRCVAGRRRPGGVLFVDFDTAQVLQWPQDVPLPEKGEILGPCASHKDVCGGRVLCCIAGREAEPGGGFLTTQEWYLWEPARESIRHLDFTAAQAPAPHPFPKPHEVTWFPDGRRLLLKRGESGPSAARSGPCRVAVFDLASHQVTPVPGVAESWVPRPSAAGRS